MGVYIKGVTTSQLMNAPTVIEAEESEYMTTKEIDAYICACPYFGGKDTIDRRLFVDGTTHIGECGLEFHHRDICPSEECRCASKLFGERNGE